MLYHALDTASQAMARDTQPRSMKIHITFQRDTDFSNAFFKFYHSNQCFSLATDILRCIWVLTLFNHACYYFVSHNNQLFSLATIKYTLKMLQITIFNFKIVFL